MEFFHLSLLAIFSVAMTTVNCYDPDFNDYANIVIGGSLKQASEGQAGIWGVTADGTIYAVNKNLNWQEVSGRLVQIDVCDRVYGVSAANKAFIRQGITHQQPLGTSWRYLNVNFKNIACSPTGPVWGINTEDKIYYSPNNGDNWHLVEGQLVQVSAGKMGVWGINKNNQVYYRKDTFGGGKTGGSDWIKTNGVCLWISSGDNVVTCLGTGGYYNIRAGISADKPEGVGWRKLGRTIKDFQRYPTLDNLMQ